MNYIKLPLTFICVLFFSAIYGQETAKVQNFIKKTNWSFLENKGQLADENGNKLSAIRYYGRQDNVNIYCKANTISFVFSKIVNSDAVSEATGQSSSDRLARRQAMMKQAAEGTGKIFTCRTDLVLVNANANASISARDQQEYFENFYTAATDENGIKGVHTFKTISYLNIYPNIDMVLHALDKGLKYEFVIHPGGDPANIQLQWNGASKMAMLKDGGLKYSNTLGEMQESRPVSFLSNGKPVTSSFVKENSKISFKTGSYDKTKTLTIDPTLLWSTYLGGSAVDNTQAMWLDNAGNVVVTGQTQSTTGIATTGAFNTSYSGGKGLNDAFVSKFTDNGKLLWSTYYGYTGYDDGWAINVDKYNNIYMTGTTSSTANIATSGAYQSLIGGTGSAGYNAYIVKFTPNGARFWATYFGSSGNDQGLFLALDGSTNIFLTCWITSSSGIATSGAYQTSYGGGGQDASLEKFDSTGTKLLWSTYYGGSGVENVNTVATDGSGNAIICGYSPSTNNIASSGGYQTTYGGGSEDAFVASFSSSGSLNWASYLGGSGNDYGWGVATDASGNVIISGQTTSTSGIASKGAYQTSLAGTSNTFVTKFSQSGKLLWSTYYGGSGTDVAYNVTTDIASSIFITGTTTSSSGFASPGAFQTSMGGSGDAFVTKFLANGTPRYSSYFGGSGSDFGWDIKVDKSDTIVYITGGSASSSGIATSGAYQSTNGGSTDAFLSKFAFHVYQNDAEMSAILAPNKAFCASSKSVSVKLTNNGKQDLKSVTIGWSINKTAQTSYSWSGTLKKDSSTTVTIGTPTFAAGIDTIVAWTIKPNSGIDSFPMNDTARIIDTISSLPKPSAGGNKSVCPGGGVTIGSTSISGHKYSWTSNPSGFTATTSSAVVTPSATTTYYLTETNTTGGCTTVDSAVVTVNPAPTANAGGNHIVCYGGTITLGTTATKSHVYTWSSVPSGFTAKTSNPTANPTVNTTYYVTETDTLTGCFAYDNATITVSAPAKASGGGNKTICSGANVTLGGTAVTGHTYSWKSKPVGFTSTVINPTVNPTVKTTYYLTDVTTATGCTALDSVVITINPLPVPNTGGNKTVCALSPYTLGAAAVTGFTYSWTSRPAGFTSTKSNPTVNPAAATTYFLTVTNTSTGCSNTDSAVIKTNPAPAVNAGGNHTICSGDNAQLGTTATTGHTYSWTSKPAGFKNATSNPLVSPTVTTTYYVTETNSTTGCSATDSAIVTVNFVSANAGGNHTICKGSSITLGQSAVSGDSYSWSSSTGGFSSTVSNPSVSPSVTTTYYLTEGNTTTGCSKIDSAVITVNPLPDAVTGSNQAVCAGGSVSLGTAPVSNNIYSWISKPAGFTSNSSNPTITPAGSAIYYLTETVQATGCTKTDSVVVIVKPLPKVSWTLNYFGKITYLHATDSSLTDPSYKWTFGDGDTATGHLAKHLYQKNKQYNISLKVTGTNGCVNKYDSTVTITISSIGQDIAGNTALNIFPNPFHTTTNIEYNLENTSKVNITLLDITGKQVGVIADQDQTAGSYHFEINADKYHLTPGVYLIKFMINNQVMSRDVVKMGN
jgi:hypothetical protein